MAEASRAAAARIHGKVVRTPLHHNPDLDARVGLSVYFKVCVIDRNNIINLTDIYLSLITRQLESLQHIGAYKLRGATNAVLKIAKEDLPKGVIVWWSINI